MNQKRNELNNGHLSNYIRHIDKFENIRFDNCQLSKRCMYIMCFFGLYYLSRTIPNILILIITYYITIACIKICMQNLNSIRIRIEGVG